MNPANIFADTDLGTLIYIIMVVLWVIGNVFGKSRKKQRRSAPVPRPGESSAEAELREFLEQLAGKPAEPEPQPQPVSTPQTRLQRKRERDRQIRPQSVIRTPPAPIAPEPPPVNLEEVAREMRDAAPSMAGSFSTTLSSMASLFKTSGLTMPALRYALSTSRPRPAQPVITEVELRDKNALRRMIASRIVLGPPRSLDPYQAETEATRIN